jgi:isopenicillin-N epimerase
MLDPDVIFLNHGSFGATPRVVLQAQSAWRDQMERQPVHFFTREFPQALRSAADRLGQFVGAAAEDLVFVDNATTGINAVVRSLSLQPGDQIVTTTHVYAAVRKTLLYVCQRSGATLIEAAVPFPLEDPSQVIDAVAAVLTRQTRLAVLDHITSATGLIFPLPELIALCHAQGIPVLVDGAHAPGMIPLDLTALGADWYTGNGHKWLCAPKGCAFLWASPARQADLHPTVLSHGLGSGFVAEFDWVGTKDVSAWLAVTAALEFHHLLGSASVRQHNHDLVLQASHYLAHTWGVELPAPDRMIGSMVTLPYPHRSWPEQTMLLEERALHLHDWLWDQHRIEVPIFPFQGDLWIRISAQVYNEMDEYCRLGDLLR